MDMDIESRTPNVKNNILNTKNQTCGVVTKRQRLPQFSFLLFAFCFYSICFIAGCESASSQKASLQERIDTLTLQNTQLENQLEQSQAEKEQLKNQIQVLSGLPEEVKGENVYNLQTIKIGKYTNLFDKDEDGKKEKLIVYIQPFDEQGHEIKAAGSVNVQLWDLDSPQTDQALLGQWDVKPEELKELWFSTMVTINYRLTFDIADKVQNYDKPLTVKVTFTDYLSGKVFKEQKVIEPITL